MFAIKENLGKCRKKPFLSLAVITIVILFGVISFTSGSVLKSLENINFLASAAESGSPLFAQSSNNLFRESPGMSFVQDNSLVAVSPTAVLDVDVLGSVLGGVESDQRDGIIEYVVEEGDSLYSIAGKFDISLNTILLTNDLTVGSVIRPGQKLVILPVTGVIHHVKSGDTLSEIAKTYKGKTSEIIEENGLSSAGDIFIGDILIIPNGEMPVVKSTNYAGSIPVGSSYFIPPVAKVHITQGLHWYNAIDFGESCGSPIFAAAAGTVQKIDYGYNFGAGNTIRVLHPNGVVTSYGHIQKATVVVGQKVSQGEQIALIGGKPGTKGAGISTGCHVHFAVHGARNPFAK